VAVPIVRRSGRQLHFFGRGPSGFPAPATATNGSFKQRFDCQIIFQERAGHSSDSRGRSDVAQLLELHHRDVRSTTCRLTRGYLSKNRSTIAGIRPVMAISGLPMTQTPASGFRKKFDLLEAEPHLVKDGGFIEQRCP